MPTGTVSTASIIKVMDIQTKKVKWYEDKDGQRLALMCPDDVLRLTPHGDDYGLKVSQNRLLTKNGYSAF